jgi:hypothetical protein
LLTGFTVPILILYDVNLSVNNQCVIFEKM